MKLISQELEKRFADVGKQDIPNPIIIAKFFNPTGAGTWLTTEYDPLDKICFGYVSGLGFDEFGSYSLIELEALRVPPFGLPIERDLYCGEKTLAEHIPDLAHEIKRREELQAIETERGLSLENDLDR